MLKRGSGVLLHVSSLPSDFGIGDVGPSAFRWIDFLHQGQQTYWQLLPLNPTDPVYGNSPYSSDGALALNPLFISPELLCHEGYLISREFLPSVGFPKESVDYQTVSRYKNVFFSRAYERFKKEWIGYRLYQDFCSRNQFWLDDYAAFVALKEHFHGASWNQWPEEFKRRYRPAIARFEEQSADKIGKIKFLQFMIHQQWQVLKNYARSQGVQIIGDIPIYVNFDSADAWANPEIFKLDETGSPRFVAGVPPDYFSETGQRWGNPVYDWNVLKTRKYDWWIKRLEENFQLFDVLRIDHFRGFAAYWEIPVQEKTAVNGKWVDGPREDFFTVLRTALPNLSLIAEDLGIITPDVTALITKFDFPGMKILLFAFGGDFKTNPYIPENYTANCVAYTGTHDNNTVKGWFEHDISSDEKRNLISYLGREPKSAELSWEFIQRLMRSKANIVIFPMQDILSLGKAARMNTPGTTQGNWQWRLSSQHLTHRLAAQLAKLTEETQRAAR